MSVLGRDRVALSLRVLAFVSIATAALIRPASLPIGVARFNRPLAADPLRAAAWGLTFAYDAVLADGNSYPASGARIAVGGKQTIGVTGWALDFHTMQPAKALLVGVDSAKSMHEIVEYGLPRPDVAAALHLPAARNSGFHALIPLSGVSRGQHRIRFAFISLDGRKTDLPAAIALFVQ